MDDEGRREEGERIEDGEMREVGEMIEEGDSMLIDEIPLSIETELELSGAKANALLLVEDALKDEWVSGCNRGTIFTKKCMKVI